MNKILYALLTLGVLTSCVDSYNIQGSSNVSTLDGRMLFLKVLKDNELKNVDSCEVVHGQFHFSGNIDSTKMATIFMDDENIMPIVLESGEIAIKLNSTQQTVSGTPLNDKLFKFIDRYNQLQILVNELGHKQSQAIMDGEDEEVTNARLMQEAKQIAMQEDSLVTNFITDNFDNVLGPGVFMMITAAYRYPELTPWIEDIMSKATDNFKNDPYVKDYYQKAQENQAIMNGMATPEGMEQPTQAAAPLPAPNVSLPVDSALSNPAEH
jgi:hypothetical protein